MAGSPEKNAILPHIITAGVTILVQLLMAAYVYGQMSTMVTLHTDEIRELQRTKLDASIYFRENPYGDRLERLERGEVHEGLIPPSASSSPSTANKRR